MTVLVPVYVVVGERAEVVDVAVVAIVPVYVETGCSLVDVLRCTAFLAGAVPVAVAVETITKRWWFTTRKYTHSDLRFL